MKFRLSSDPKINPTGARSCPQGFGRFIDAEPGDEFDVYDIDLLSNPTYRDLLLFEPADDEARTALDKARAALEPDPAEEEAAPVEDQDPGEDPVIAAIREEAAARAEQRAEETPQLPEVQRPFDTPADTATPAAVADPAPVDAASQTPAAAEDPKTIRAPRARTPQED